MGMIDSLNASTDVFVETLLDLPCGGMSWIFPGGDGSADIVEIASRPAVKQ